MGAGPDGEQEEEHVRPWEDALRVVVIGLDGGDWSLIEPWVQEGKLPTFQRLMAEGAWGRLRSTMPPITAPAWSSFITGKNPGKHGLIDFVFRQRESYHVSPVNASLRRGRSLWALLGDGGKRVLVVNVPVTYPPEPVPGYLVSGLLTPSERSAFTHPPELAAELRAAGYRIHTPQSYARGDIDRFLRDIYETTDIQWMALQRLMSSNPWDLAMYVFRGTDRIQHGLWHFMDAGHPLHGAPGTEKYRDAIQEYYQYIDQKLAGLLGSLDGRTLLILMSDHGAGPFHKYIYMNNWLLRWGLLKLRNRPQTRLKRAGFDLGLTPINVYNLLLRLGLGRLKGKVTKGKGAKSLSRLFLSFQDVDWEQTRAYSLGNAGQLWINLRGREPRGIVEPGANYAAVRRDLVARVREMRDPATGEKMVDEVFVREDLYEGPYVEQMPDVVFVPKGFRYLSFGEYEFASHRLVDVSLGITGWHRLQGMVLLHGAPIRAEGKVVDARIEDLAPTILYLMGQPVPADMDGQLLSGALKPSWLDAKRLEKIDVDPDTERDRRDLSDEDEEQVRKRLQGLGYLG